MGIDYPCPVQLRILDLPLDSGGVDGLFVAAWNLDPGATWRGCEIWQSPKERSAFRKWGRISEQSIPGLVDVTPDPGVFREGARDERSVVVARVSEHYSPLETVSEALLDAGRNRFLIGGEIVGVRDWEFQRVTPQLERVYVGRGLRRGLCGTGGNAAGLRRRERMLWLDGGGVDFHPLPAALRDPARSWRAIPMGGTLQEAETVHPERVERFSGRLDLARSWVRWRSSSPARRSAP